MICIVKNKAIYVFPSSRFFEKQQNPLCCKINIWKNLSPIIKEQDTKAIPSIKANLGSDADKID